MTALPEGYFDAMYDETPDPWGFETRWYEKRKYALTSAMLPRERYRSGFEPGCSIGVLTEQLAARCEKLRSTDIADAALDRARGRGLTNVAFEKMSLRDGWPEDTFDLVVLSEMCYYFTEVELPGLFSSAARVLEPGGTLIAVHWRHYVADYPTTAEQVHAALRATDGLELVSEYRDTDMFIDVFQREEKS